MLQDEIAINDDNIIYAETILFGKEGAFDDDEGERKTFIKNLDTVDLQAVPGSGKTTVLLAKLLILERYLPFQDGSGILVISHTNTAVDEIKNRIGKHCPKLFAYPSYVGTIQSFVDRFLAIPYFSERFEKRPHRIYDDIYNEKHYEPPQAKGWLSRRPDKHKIVYQSRLLDGDILGYDISKNGADFPLRKEGSSPTYSSLVQMKTKIRNFGVLCYDDAYILAMKAIETYPIFKLLLQKRFRYVFVDEMQDMDRHQHDLLEELFYDGGNSPTDYQRIGDINQAIYSKEVIVDTIWEARAPLLNLKGSRRLPPNIAKVVEPFGTTKTEIKSENCTNKDGTENNIPPHVIFFDDNSAEKVIPKFCELIKKYKEEGKIPEENPHQIKAIAWRSGKDGKFGLKSYWPDYWADAVKSKIDHSNLKSYLVFANKNISESKGLEGIYKSVMNALLRVLRLEEVTNPDNKRAFTVRSLNKYLKEKNVNLYERFRLRVYGWCLDIWGGNIGKAYKEIKQVVPRFLKFSFDRKLDKATDFVNEEVLYETCSSDKSGDSGKAKGNVYRCKRTGLEVEVGTVHSVKGETHTATLYLESYYRQDGRGKNAKSYESQRLKEQFAGQSIFDNAGKWTKQSARMVYVGFSRPTHLLCFAVHKGRCDEAVFESSGWEIRTL